MCVVKCAPCVLVRLTIKGKRLQTRTLPLGIGPIESGYEKF